MTVDLPATLTPEVRQHLLVDVRCCFAMTKDTPIRGVWRVQCAAGSPGHCALSELYRNQVYLAEKHQWPQVNAGKLCSSDMPSYGDAVLRWVRLFYGLGERYVSSFVDGWDRRSYHSVFRAALATVWADDIREGWMDGNLLSRQLVQS